MQEHVNEGYRSFKSILDYIVKMNDSYRGQADVHLAAQKILFPSLYRPSAEPIKEPTERKDTMYTVIDKVHSYHKDAVLKLAEFTNKVSLEILDKGLRPKLDEYKAEVDHIAAQCKEMLKGYEKVGKASYIHFDVLDDCFAKCIKADEEGKTVSRDFWLDYSNYIHCIHEESNYRSKILSEMGKLFEKIKEMEKTRVEVCSKYLKEYLEMTKKYLEEVASMYSPVTPVLTQTDSTTDVKILTEALAQLKEKKLTEEERKICNKPPLDTIPPITKGNTMVIKYGVLARRVQPPSQPRQPPPPATWVTVHIVVTQDYHLLAFNGGDSLETEALFIQKGCVPVCDMSLQSCIVGDREKIAKHSFQLTEKVRKFGLIPTVTKNIFKVGNQADYDDWMNLFKKLHVGEDNSSYLV